MPLPSLHPTQQWSRLEFLTPVLSYNAGAAKQAIVQVRPTRLQHTFFSGHLVGLITANPGWEELVSRHGQGVGHCWSENINAMIGKASKPRDMLPRWAKATVSWCCRPDQRGVSRGKLPRKEPDVNCCSLAPTWNQRPFCYVLLCRHTLLRSWASRER